MKRLLPFMLLCCLIALAACGGTTPAEEPDLVATQVAVERAAAATLTAEAVATQAGQPTTAAADTATPIPPTATPTEQAAVATETQAPTPAPTATPTPLQPTPTPTQITAVVFPVDGSDGNESLRGSFVQSKGGRNVLLFGIEQAQVTNPMVFRERIPARVEIFDDTVGLEDGDGIVSVEFIVTGPSGDEVLRVTEETAPYCMWGGNEPNCPAPSFAELGYTWPQTGVPIENGLHSVEIVITGTQYTGIVWFWSFVIEHDQEEAAAPVEVVLRPACGNQVGVPINTPIDLIYGIWANRGQQRAIDNAPYTETTLIVDGQDIAGEVVQSPVADLPSAICDRDYEDSYWVYSRAQLPPLTPGVHYVQVRYSFTQPVDDGYGATYTQPFTQQYQIVVE